LDLGLGILRWWVNPNELLSSLAKTYVFPAARHISPVHYAFQWKRLELCWAVITLLDPNCSWEGGDDPLLWHPYCRLSWSLFSAGEILGPWVPRPFGVVRNVSRSRSGV